jgi:hypothetical protein
VSHNKIRDQTKDRISRKVTKVTGSLGNQEDRISIDLGKIRI